MRTTKLRSGKSPSLGVVAWSCSTNLFLRDFVADYWPNAGTPGSNIRNMYDRIANSASAVAAPAQQEPTIKVEPPHMNGQINGVAVKQEQKG